jgi:lantibiotic biosynthesis protein
MTAAIEPAPFFVLRAPLLPFDEWLAFAGGLAAPAASDGDVPPALAADRERARARLRAVVARPEVREALFLASPSLDDALDVWMQAPDSERGRKAERTLVRYFARLCGRATPFGLFAGCALGRVDVRAGESRLSLAPRARFGRHTRLGMDYLFALGESLARDPELQPRLRYRPNSSLYRAAGRLRYVEAQLNGKSRAYRLVAVEPSEYLDATLKHAQNGATAAQLAAELARQAAVDEDEARAFVDELAAQQLIVADVQPPVTGPEPIFALLRRLEGHAAAPPLARVRDGLAAIDAEPLGTPPARYRRLAEELRPLPLPVELPRLFQADLVMRGDFVLGAAAMAELERGVALLQRLTPPRDPLRRFRRAFVARYEAAEVPLSDVLDEESGLGFGGSTSGYAPLIAGLPFGDDGVAQVDWGARETLLLEKLTAALARGEREIRLDERDVARLSPPSPPPLPDAFAVVASFVAPSAAALTDGNFAVHMMAVSGPSGIKSLGRFCHGDPELAALVAGELRAEESHRPDAVFAEVVHLPEGHVGNLLLRPLLRAHEVPFLGVSGAPAERQLTLDDLTVAVEGERVVLRSRRLRREILPRLSTAHDYGGKASLGPYRFLGMLQSQGVAGSLAWSWGPLESAAFLPRVTAGRLILEHARWRIGAQALAPLAAAVDDEHRWRAARSLRRELGLPRLVAVEDRDHRLLVDFDHVLSLDSFAQLIKGLDEVVLLELPAPDALPVTGPDGRYVHELVVPFRRRAIAPETTTTAATTTTATAATAATTTTTATATTAAATVQSVAASQRRIVPGGDWLYVKLYAGAATLDGVLCDLVAPLVRDAVAAGSARHWFFVRLEDPDWHLRLRLVGDGERLRAEVEPALWRATRALVDDGRLWRAQLDTYHRELERYGGPDGLRLCEALFHADSDAVLAILERLDGDAAADARWRLALAGGDAILEELGFDLDARHALVSSLRDSFGREFSVGGDFVKLLGERFRRERATLESLFDADAAHPLRPALDILAARRARQAPLVAELRAAALAGRLTQPLPSLAVSLVHMHVNRMLRTAARAHELVIYDFLQRLYEGRRARRRRPS